MPSGVEQNTAIIVAGGQGARLGGPRAKQFLQLAGRPVIVHTLQRFEQCAAIDEIILVLPAAETSAFLRDAGRWGLRKLARVVAGGASRAESVWRGLQAVNAATAGVVAVHDGVRPFVTPDEIAATVAAAAEHGAAVLVAPVVDTIKEVRDGKIISTPPRADLRRALTPQCFRYDLLRRAYEQAGDFSDAATDDSLLVERAGHVVRIVEGSARNIKITTPDDLALAETLLRQ
jgi:2-C-methyl-D-erythritol 4-phosphate cytidylyltransferase